MSACQPWRRRKDHCDILQNQVGQNDHVIRRSLGGSKPGIAMALAISTLLVIRTQPRVTAGLVPAFYGRHCGQWQALAVPLSGQGATAVTMTRFTAARSIG
jgi:hypothetical protein